MSQGNSKVKLHPASVKHLKKGHPWVTKDKFSEKFPNGQRFLSAIDEKGKVFCHLLNDPGHKNVKARLWEFSNVGVLGERKFKETFIERIEKAVKKRKDLRLTKERDNLYLVFAEADFLPGLYVQLFEQVLYISSYSEFWDKYKFSLSEKLKELCAGSLGKELIACFYHSRDHKQKNRPELLFGKLPHNYSITEFGVNYHLGLEEGYDVGIYSDMSSIRKLLAHYFKDCHTLLNLYSYTGAYSLFPLKCGARRVYSVDVSKKNMTRLEENLMLNGFEEERHVSMVKNTQKALEKLKKDKVKFDFIVCDPPTSSSDGKKITPILKSYRELIPQFVNIMKPGGYLLLFNNTHQDNWSKFEKVIIEEFSKIMNFNILKKFRLGEDCPTLRGFPEGDYLKGFLIQIDH